MLEKIVKSLNYGIIGVAVPVVIAACGPSASIPVDTSAKYGLTCCEILDCSGKDYDGCRDKGKAVENGVIVDTCGCYNVQTESSSSSSNSYDWRDRNHGYGIDYDRGRNSGHWECPDKD